MKKFFTISFVALFLFMMVGVAFACGQPSCENSTIGFNKATAITGTSAFNADNTVQLVSSNKAEVTGLLVGSIAGHHGYGYSTGFDNETNSFGYANMTSFGLTGGFLVKESSIEVTGGVLQKSGHDNGMTNNDDGYINKGTFTFGGQMSKSEYDINVGSGCGLLDIDYTTGFAQADGKTFGFSKNITPGFAVAGTVVKSNSIAGGASPGNLTVMGAGEAIHGTLAQKGDSFAYTIGVASYEYNNSTNGASLEGSGVAKTFGFSNVVSKGGFVSSTAVSTAFASSTGGQFPPAQDN